MKENAILLDMETINRSKGKWPEEHIQTGFLTTEKLL